MSDNRYRLSTTVEPFMKTTRENNGYATSYAQIRVHHGTHADFPPHVGLDGGPRWDLSGDARIFTTPTPDPAALRPVSFFDIGATQIPEDTIDALLVNDVEVVGTSHDRVGGLEAHERLLEDDVVIVENLVNLSDPPTADGYVHCYALVIDGCDDGAPVTAAFEPCNER
ncbi:hypothetical protein [Haloarchaeobius baliensis]|uniref:hypothetical protein n=1 Tax=Haloarchaeobius baliensis TaxID=1670458 RepID=UPI003F881159